MGRCKFREICIAFSRGKPVCIDTFYRCSLRDDLRKNRQTCYSCGTGTVLFSHLDTRQVSIGRCTRCGREQLIHDKTGG